MCSMQVLYTAFHEVNDDMNEPLPTFTTGRLSAAFDLPVPTIQTWQKMGVFNLLDSPPAASMGRARRFTVRDVYQVGIIRRLSENGVPPRYAAIAARRAVDAVDEFGADQVQTLAMNFFDDDQRAPVVQIYGPGTEKPPPADAIMTLLVKLPMLFDRIKQRFDATAPVPASLVDVRELA